MPSFFLGVAQSDCKENEFKCTAGVCKHDNPYCNGACIPNLWLKDGEEDCTDGSDEAQGTVACRKTRHLPTLKK